MNTTSHTKVAVIGAGLAGLQAARLLARAGVEHLVIEARDRPGGRILSVDADGTPGGAFDLGPSWYWPEMQPAIGELVNELGLAGFEQHAEGEMIVERTLGEAPRRLRGYPQAPASMRLLGGTSALIRALVEKLVPGTLMLATRVTGLRLVEPWIEIEVEHAAPASRIIRAEQVIAALPPRLLEASVRFDPPLDPATARHWRETPTWMAPHAKFVALYDRPFWRAAGLSGDAQSAVGPMVEIHDACTANGEAALFGFVGVPADRRSAAGDAALKRACRDQLIRLFGEEAGTPRTVLLKDWAADPLTAVAEDRLSSGHVAVMHKPWVRAPWSDRVTLAGSETSPSDSGYPLLLSEVRTALARALGADAGDFHGVAGRAESIRNLTNDFAFEAFCTRAAAFDGGDGDLEGLASLLVHKPAHSWSDRDREQALLELAKLGRRFREAEALASVRDRRSSTEAMALVVGVDPRLPPLLSTFELTEEEKVAATALADDLIARLSLSGPDRHLRLAALARAVASVAGEREAA